MKSIHRTLIALLVAIAICLIGDQARAQSGQAAQEIQQEVRQEGDHKVLVRSFDAHAGEMNAKPRPSKKLSPEQLQLLDQQKSASPGPRLLNPPAPETLPQNNTTFDSRPVLKQSPGYSAADSKTNTRPRLVSSPDPNLGKSEVIEDNK